MSHFAVLIAGTDPDYQLAPFHEFECTGTDNEFVREVDETEARRKSYQEDKSTRLKAPDGSLHYPYDDRFYRDPLPEETKTIGAMAGTGCGHGLSWTSKNWGDGKGYRPKVRFIPDGWEETGIFTGDVQTFAEWLAVDGKESVTYAQLDLGEKHKYGYALVDDSGAVLKVVDRTNPNAKWDWYSIGGRYSNRLLLKTGQRADSARKGDVDWFGIERDAATTAENTYRRARLALDDQPAFETWKWSREKHGEDIDAARAFYNAQPAVKAFSEYNRANEYCFGIFDGPDAFRMPLAEYLQNAVDAAFVLFAFVKDRQWQERGEMGWFACVSNEKDEADWNKTFRAFVDSLPDDEILTVVDCHI